MHKHPCSISQQVRSSSLLRYSGLLLLLGALLLAPGKQSWALDSGYLGIKAGLVDIDSPFYDEALNLGLTVGAKFIQRGNHSVALEGELTRTLIDGDTSTTADWSLDTLGLYGAFRLGSKTYLKLKGGYLDYKLKVGGGSVDDDGFSWGIGVGIPLRRGNTLEIEYTVLGSRNNTDISYLSVGYMF